MPSPDVFVIAEAGVNHNGSIDLALEMVQVAARSGADAVKFQTFKAEEVAAANAPKAVYQARETGANESQLAMLRALELSEADFQRIARACEDCRIELMSTPFDHESVRFLAQRIGVKRLKCPSGEVTNGPLLLAMARSGLPIILSTGMADLDEIAEALAVLAYGYSSTEMPRSLTEIRERAARPECSAELARRVTILHCTSAYPAPTEELNLRAMATIHERFGLPVGYSDHSMGIPVSLAAVALGARVIEKHFTLDRSMPGPDHKASLEPGDFAALVAGIREVSLALGRSEKEPTPSEIETRTVARRSLVAARKINTGDRLEPGMLKALRPSGGLSPMIYWDLLGSSAPRNFEAGEPYVLDEPKA